MNRLGTRLGSASLGPALLGLALLGLALLGLALSACTTISDDAGTFDPIVGRARTGVIEDRARMIADGRALTTQSIHVDTNDQRFDSDSDRTANTYTAWLKVAECDEGHLVIKFNFAALPIQTFTRFGCMLDGIPNY